MKKEEDTVSPRGPSTNFPSSVSYESYRAAMHPYDDAHRPSVFCSPNFRTTLASIPLEHVTPAQFREPLLLPSVLVQIDCPNRLPQQHRNSGAHFANHAGVNSGRIICQTLTTTSGMEKERRFPIGALSGLSSTILGEPQRRFVRVATAQLATSNGILMSSIDFATHSRAVSGRNNRLFTSGAPSTTILNGLQATSVTSTPILGASAVPRFAAKFAFQSIQSINTEYSECKTHFICDTLYVLHFVLSFVVVTTIGTVYLPIAVECSMKFRRR